MDSAVTGNTNGHSFRRWSRAEVKKLGEMFRAGSNDEEIAKALDRNASAISKQRSIRGFTKFRRRAKRKQPHGGGAARNAQCGNRHSPCCTSGAGVVPGHQGHGPCGDRASGRGVA